MGVTREQTRKLAPRTRYGSGLNGDHAGNAAARILVVDDEASNVEILVRILARAGFRHVKGTTDPRGALQLLEDHNPDLILLDLQMPAMDGLAVLTQLRAAIPSDCYLPILMLTANDSVQMRQRALSMGAKDFLGKPFDISEVLLRIRNLIETRSLHLALRAQNQNLERRVAERTAALERTQVEVLERLAAAAEFRDDATGRHTQRVAALAGALAVDLGVGETVSSLIRRAAPLHDVGKIGVPDRILLKPGRLTPRELGVMRTHTTIGARILGGGKSAMIQMAQRIAQSHHERWDGKGYPYGLAGEAIPLEARIVAIADFFDALTHDRPYRSARPVEIVRVEISRRSGAHFDPQVAEAFLSFQATEQMLR
ncbi:MAG TPA: HD domain-containing phosphohydrolase [Gemmatimonadales bacterium]|nr:HD domain-containing phosphohydrolase [Gemmatimonadales bacterium]